jgi:hypothetical protein
VRSESFLTGSFATSPPDHVRAVRAVRAAGAAGAVLAPFGVLRLATPFPPDPALPERQRREYAALNALPRVWRAVAGEAAAMEASLAQAGAAGPLGTRPLLVVSSTEGAPSAAAAAKGLALQADLATPSSDSAHLIVPGATHAGLAHDPERARSTSAAVLRVVEAVRTGAAVGPAPR